MSYTELETTADDDNDDSDDIDSEICWLLTLLYLCLQQSGAPHGKYGL